MMQVPLGATVPPQGLVWPKSPGFVPVKVMLEMPSATVWLLVTVIFSAVLAIL